jgi:hypothetical protein
MVRSQGPRGLRRGSAAARLLRLWFRFPPGSWMFVACEYYVLSGRGLCDEMICRPEESCRMWCVDLCDLETSRVRRPCPALDRSAIGKNILCYISISYFSYMFRCISHHLQVEFTYSYSKPSAFTQLLSGTLAES